MEVVQDYAPHEVIGDNPGDLREAVAELPQQLDESITPKTRETEPVIDLNGEKMHPRDLLLKPDTAPGRLVRYVVEHKTGAAKVVGVVTVAAVLGAYAGVRLRKRRKH